MSGGKDEEVPVTTPSTRKRRVLITVASIVALATIVAAAVFAVTQLGRAPAAAPKAVNVITEKVARGDLLEQVRVQGTLAFANPETLGTSLEGTLTGLPAIGAVVGVGDELFRIDDSPVVFMHGSIPAWRAIGIGVPDGPDIEQLERGLVHLGYMWGEPSKKFTADTASAVRAWQKDFGLEVTGEVNRGRVYFAPNDLRVEAHAASVGDAAGAEIISVTGSTKEILAFVDPAQQPLTPLGASLDVALPGGGTTTATVTAVGGPVEKEGPSGTSLKVPVTLIPNDPDAVSSFDSVGVGLTLTNLKAADALLLPVSALLAQPGGGYSVDVVVPKPAAGEPGTRGVAVELGAFADGFVAVTGGDLAEGDSVVVAK